MGKQTEELIVPRFCWRPAQVHPYESAWSLLAKFCRWNSASASDVRTLFIRAGSVSPPLWGRFPKIEARVFGELCHLTEQQLHEACIDRYLPAEMLAEDGTWDWQTVRFCPKCVARGYHSPIHELAFVEKCPIHDCALLRHCPRCGANVVPAVHNRNSYAVYSCSAGHSLWPVDRNSSLHEHELRVMADLVAWLDLARGSRKLRAHVRRTGYQISRGVSLTQLRHLPGLIAQIDPTLRPLPKALFQTPQEEDRPASTAVAVIDDAVELSTEPDEMVLSVYKAVARRFTRRIRGDGSPGPFVALCAWKIFWEGCQSYRTVFARRGGTAGTTRDAVLEQFAALCPQAARDGENLTIMRHLIAAAAAGTFLEALRLQEKYPEVGQAGQLAREITGEDIPLIVTSYDNESLSRFTLQRSAPGLEEQLACLLR